MLIHVEIGTQLKEFRKKLKLTQMAMAEKVGCTPIDICRWEKGKHKPSLDSVVAIRTAFPDFLPF
jgi:DNA-binding XRE family transcriptional regulator